MTRKQYRPAIHELLQTWLAAHLRALLFSLGKIYHTPLASMMTILVIGIALALPGTLYVLLDNARQIGGKLDIKTRLSVYLGTSATLAAAEKLYHELEQRDDITEVTIINKQQAWEIYRQETRLHDTLNLLQHNPLPHTLIITPREAYQSNDNIVKLQQHLEQLPIVEKTRLDLQWLQRLNAIMNILQRGVTLIAALLILAATLIVSNTIRLDILNRQQEIEIAKLIGATNAFIRRPFLYGGMWYGLFGAIAAIVTVHLLIALMSQPVFELARLYGANPTLNHLAKLDSGLLSLGILLGLLGSWLAVGRHLRSIQPR